MKTAMKLKTLFYLLLISISLVLPCQAWGDEDWLDRGVSSLKTQRIDEAIEAFSRAIAVNPDRVEAYNNRGIAWCKRGDYDRALADYNKVLELAPRCAEAYNNRGIIWFYQDKFDLAISDYDKALGIDPRFAKAYSNRGAAWFCKGEMELAIADYNRALEINPNSAETNRQLAWILSVYSGKVERKKEQKPDEATKPAQALKPKEKSKAHPFEPPRQNRTETPNARSSSKRAFSIQVGAFSSREKAEKLTTLLKDEGYEARLLPLQSWRNEIFYTVRIGDYATRQEAKEKAAAFSAREGMPSTVRPADEL